MFTHFKFQYLKLWNGDILISQGCSQNGAQNADSVSVVLGIKQTFLGLETQKAIYILFFVLNEYISLR